MSQTAAARAAPGRVRTVPPPLVSGIADWYRGADLADSYAVTLPGPGPHDLSALAERVLGNQPAWFWVAMWLRDTAVRPFGIETSDDLRDRVRRLSTDHVEFFPVLSRSPREIVLGEDDRHLDFRLSVQLGSGPDGREQLTATTVVRCHNLLGRAYLTAIRVGHVLIVRSALRRAASLP